MEIEQKIDFAKIEKKWQEKWEKEKVFEVSEDKKKKKYYVLEMFPYPSASGLHMGHAWNYTIGDIFARFKILQGFNVLHPMGYDSLGLPAENAAIQAGKHPEDYTNESIKNYIRQQKKLGLSYDWSRVVNTANPDYYQWDQWIFLKMFEKGLVYEKKAPVNWCPKCNTILANEQVHEGKCWRHEDTEVEVKNIRQLFLKITDYADRLLEGHKTLNWPEKTIAMQKNWIGKSHGTEIDFMIENKDISKVIIVHGANADEKSSKEGGVENTRHWHPWIKKELEKENIKVSAELYPKDWKPDYKDWKKMFEKNNVDEKTVLVGHSLGCAFILRWLRESKKKVRKVILVAPYVSDDGEAAGLKDFVTFDFDSSLRKYYKDLVVFYDKKDMRGVVDSVNLIKEKLSPTNIEFVGKGHFTKESMKTEEFPELLKEIFSEKWPIFTTRPDTIYGVTFMVVSAQHPRLNELVTKEQEKAVEEFLKKLKSVSEKELADMEKEGVFTGSYAINPINGDKVPVYAGNFVVADYGSGMVMAVPAHDQRDFEFAKKYNITIKQVIVGKDPLDFKNRYKGDKAFTQDGLLMSSKQFSGGDNQAAKAIITDFLAEKGLARKTTNYKLRDWSVARQRYWGTPIPLVHCDKCGIVPVPEKDLPVKLPKEVKFGKGNPLETNEEWLNVKCPKCGGKAKREPNTMDTFVNSSWYFLRYCDPQNKKEIFSKDKAKYWMPIDLYIGGAEHACMHLIYFRFYTMFLHDLGLISFEEPAPRLFHQGMLAGEGGVKMSKSKPETCVLPEEVSDKYGIDTARFFLCSLAAPDKNIDWDEKGIQGSSRFINKIYGLSEKIKFGKDSPELKSKLNKTVKNITEQIERLEYRKSTIELRELFDLISEQKEVSKETFEESLKLLSPFCPHMTEELWEKLGNKGFISSSSWPEYKEEKVKKESQDVTEKIIQNIKPIIEKLEGKKVFLYVLPFELENVSKEKIAKAIGKEVEIFSVQDNKKYDPENKSKKAKPTMPGIFVE